MKLRAAMGLLVLGFVAGCGGGGGTAAVTVPRPLAATLVPVAFQIKIPSAPTISAAERRAAYVSPGTKLAQVVVNGATTSLPCSANMCSGSVSALGGDDTFVITLEDAQGNLLSAGSLTQKIIVGTANAVLISCDGVPASATITWIDAATFTDGTAATSRFTVNVLDAAGYTIIGNWNSIALGSIIDSRDTTHFALSKTVLTSSSDAAETLSYDGSTAIHPSPAPSGAIPVELQVTALINGTVSSSSNVAMNPVPVSPITGPSSVSILGLGAANEQVINVAAAGYGTGSFTASSDSNAVTVAVGATVSDSAQVTLVGASAGTANVTISDTFGAALVIPVTVTTTSLVAQ